MHIEIVDVSSLNMDELPMISDTHPDLTHLECARLCLSTPSCLMFYMETGDNPGCQLTDADITGTIPNLKDSTLYMIG